MHSAPVVVLEQIHGEGSERWHALSNPGAIPRLSPSEFTEVTRGKLLQSIVRCLDDEKLQVVLVLCWAKS